MAAAKQSTGKFKRDHLSVKMFGAKGIFAEYEDGIASGDDFSTTSTDLSEDNAGLTIVIRGAGAAGAPHITTIASVTGNNTAKLADAAPTDVSGARWQIYRDETDLLQKAINAVPWGGSLSGIGDRYYAASSLLLKSGITLRNLRVVTVAGSTWGQSPITIDGTAAAKETIALEDIEVNGNRWTRTNIVNPENGGCHGVRVVGNVSHVKAKNLYLHHCASDGICLFSNGAQGATDADDDLCFHDIQLESLRLEDNRRHGGSADSLAGVSIRHVVATGNGCPLSDSNGSEGEDGDKAGGDYYGNGWDFEGYGVGTGINGLVVDGFDGRGNAKGLLFYDTADSSAAGFLPRRNIQLSNLTLDPGIPGTPSEPYALSMTSTLANASNTTRLYQNVKVGGVMLGFCLFRSTGKTLIEGHVISTISTALTVVDSDDFTKAANLHGGTLFRERVTSFTEVVQEIDYLTHLSSLTAQLPINGATVAEIASGSVQRITFTATPASPTLTTGADHHFTLALKVRLTSTGTLPTGFSPNTDYFVATMPATDTVQLTDSYISGVLGAPITPSDAGTGVHTIQVRTFLVRNYGGGDLLAIDDDGVVTLLSDAMVRSSSGALTLRAGTNIVLQDSSGSHGVYLGKTATTLMDFRLRASGKDHGGFAAQSDGGLYTAPDGAWVVLLKSGGKVEIQNSASSPIFRVSEDGASNIIPAFPSIAGNASKVLTVKADESGVEWA